MSKNGNPMMSGLAIASVTAVLKDVLDNRLIQQSASAGLGDVAVTALPPDRIPIGADERPQLNLFLYRIAPNTAWRSHSPYAADGNGSSETLPLSLDAYYLLAAYGEQDLQAEILLGQAIQALHETPVITHETIHRYLGQSGEPGDNHLPSRVALRESSIADVIEQIRIYPDFLSIDDSSKLWSALQARYRPSVTYKVSIAMNHSNG